MNTINTKNGIYEYERVDLFYGRKIIDIENSRVNLLDLKKLFDAENLKFGIIYGTLLGAVREKNFISYDEDVDVYILDEYRDDLLALLFRLRDIGLDVARYENDLLSIIRNDDYIDIYIFKKTMFGNRICGPHSLKRCFFSKFSRIDFLGVTFYTLNDYKKFLEFAYGKDWIIPKKNAPADANSYFTRLKIKLKKVLPSFVIAFLKKIFKLGRG